MNFLKKMVVILIAIQSNFNPFSRNIKPTYLNKFGNVPFSHVYSTNYGKTVQNNVSNNVNTRTNRFAFKDRERKKY